MRTGYNALVSAAFSIAADKRFTGSATAADVIDYVAAVRSRADSAASLDPRIAERVLLAVISDEEIGDIDARASFEAQLVLLAALTADANLDAAQLDSFMIRARRLADQWLS